MDNSRRMLYPYTLTAKVMQFPFKYYYNNSGLFKCYVWATIILLPFMYKIQKATFSPGAIKKKERRLRLEQEEYLEHLQHLR